MYSPSGVANKEELVTTFAPLVKRIAYHLVARLPPSVLVDDLIQSGLIGLLDAANQYDERQGASFETYATIRIRGAMLDELRRNDWAPKSVHRKAREIADAIHRVERAVGREATDQEVAVELGMDLEAYHRALNETRASRMVNIDDVAADGGVIAQESGTTAAPLEHLQRERFHKSLAQAIAGLPERERVILALYYDKELNLREIGAVFNVSESRISQLLSQSHQRLRARLSDWTG